MPKVKTKKRGHSARILTAWKLLGPLRPARLEGVINNLRHYERLIVALQLIEDFFPGELERYQESLSRVRCRFTLHKRDYRRAPEKVGWWQVLADFFNLIERDALFEINWSVVNEASACWVSEESDDRGEFLATYLTYIPASLYGFTHHDSLLKFPPMELLHALLSDCEPELVSASVLSAAEIYDQLDMWTGRDRAAAWRFLARIEADPGAWPEPIRNLPELARFACHRTGNVVLDQYFNPYQNGPWLTWANEMSQLAQCWKRAKPVIEQCNRLVAWCEHEPGNIAKLAGFVMGGAEIEVEDKTIEEIQRNIGDIYYELDW